MFLQEYEKIRQLGKGAFASVYKVRHSKLGYIRALKVCNNFIEDENDKAWQTFVSECKVLLRIGNGSHPNIVRIYQPRLLDNRAVVEMDCVEGESLHDYIRENRIISLAEFYRFAQQIIGAVAYSHVDVYKFQMNPVEDNLEIDPTDGRKYIVSSDKEQELIRKYGVVHNDLHSGNIIRRDYDGQYVLLDFGLAIQDSHCVKSSSRFDGAIEYCAPEKLERGDISTQSDVYALGILLYEMLTGGVPFPYNNSDGSSPESARNRVYMQHLNETPPSIYDMRKLAYETTHTDATYVQDYPEQLETLILKCLEKNPSDRFRNAKELLNAFESIVDKESLQSYEISNQPDNSSSDVKALMNEMRQLRQEVETLRKSSQTSSLTTSKPIQEDTSNQDKKNWNVSAWFLSNLNWLWFTILCITCTITGICVSSKYYDDSGLLGAITMCTGSASVIFPWIFKWKNIFVNVVLILLWLASVITAIIFTSDPVYPSLIIMGGASLIGICVVITSALRK